MRNTYDKMESNFFSGVAVCLVILFLFVSVTTLSFRKDEPTENGDAIPTVYDKTPNDDLPNEAIVLSELLKSYDLDVPPQNAYDAFNVGRDELYDLLDGGRYEGMALPSAVVIAANNILSPMDGKIHAENITGTDLNQLVNLVDNHGKRVMVWLTRDMAEPDGIEKTETGETICRNYETYVITGVEGNTILLENEHGETLKYDIEDVWSIYDSTGQKSIALREENN